MSIVLGPPSPLELSRNVAFVDPEWGDAAAWTASLAAILGAPTSNLITRQPSQVAGYSVAEDDLILTGRRTVAASLAAVCIPYATATPSAQWRIQVGDSAGEAGAATVFDQTTAARHGTRTGGSFVPGVYGSALACDGATCILAPSFSTSTDVTYALWVRLESLGTVQTLFEHDYGGSVLTAEVLANGKIRVDGKSGTDTATALVLNTWTHVAIVRVTPDVVRIYLDGVNVTDSAVAGLHTYTGVGGWSLGNAAVVTANGLVGSVDDVRLYDRVLSSSEIAALVSGAEASAPFDANLQLYYRLNGYDSGLLTFGAAPNLATYTRRCGIHFLPYALTPLALRVTLSDPTNTAPLYLGRMVAGGVYQPPLNFDFGFQAGFRDATKKSLTPTGQTTTRSSVPVPFLDFTIRHQKREAIFLHFYELQRRYGTSQPLVVCADPGDDEYLQMLTLYGLADDLSPMVWQWAEGWETSWRFEAML